ncbi:MAG TPA: hypothetical protein VEQ59_11405 [Polyangiaceae bacterium]|nr:hypothetical protein [Polyangiaceae bacterium]
MARCAATALTVLAASACSSESLTRALEEPIRIPDSQFREGALPGSPPLTADDINAGVTPTPPVVSGISLVNALIPPREPARSISGVASPGSVAIGVRFADLGSGYWLLPTRAADAVNDNALEWRFRAAFGADAPPGKHQLLFAAIDANGHAGNQVGLSLCLLPEIPDNGSSCDPSQAPPALVVSLGWQAAVDLDLRVVTPSGKVVDSKHPTTAEKGANGKLDVSAAGVGVIDYDSFAGCVPDGRRRESLVFQSSPAPGTYLLYANLYDACGQPGASFEASVSRAVPGHEPDTLRLEEVIHQAGELQAVHANGGDALGLFVTSFTVR